MEKYVQNLIKNNKNIKVFSIANKKILCLYIPNICNNTFLQEFLINQIEEIVLTKKEKLYKSNIIGLEEIANIEIENKLFTGSLIIFEGSKIYSIDISSFPSRSPETSPSELTIAGSKDAFIEDINTNISLIQKRVKSQNFIIKDFSIGSKIKTNVKLIYLDDEIEKDIVLDITRRLKNINTDYLYNAGHLQALLFENDSSLIPLMNYTTRADFCYQSLLSGRYALFIENIPLSLIAPVNLSFFTNFSDTSNEHFLVALFERFIQYIALFIGIFLSGLSVVLLAYHIDFLPYLFLADFISARKGVAMDIITEMIIADLFFQIFRIAGTKSLSGLNQALLIMGSIIIGQIAVSSGILTQEIVLISALSIISPYLFSNNLSFNNSINILRIIVFFSSCLFGLIGFCVSSFCVILYLATLKSHNLDFSVNLTSMNFQNFKNLFLSKSIKKKDININNTEEK